MDSRKKQRLSRIFYNINKKACGCEFNNTKDFIKWYEETERNQKGRCYYCQTKQEHIIQLIENEIITSKRFVTRGKNLEVKGRQTTLTQQQIQV